MSVLAVCCACGDRSSAPHFGPGLELKRGLAYIGRGKWICAGCTKTAVAEFAVIGAKKTSAAVESTAAEEALRKAFGPGPFDEPPPA